MLELSRKDLQLGVDSYCFFHQVFHFILTQQVKTKAYTLIEFGLVFIGL